MLLAGALSEYSIHLGGVHRGEGAEVRLLALQSLQEELLRRELESVDEVTPEIIEDLLFALQDEEEGLDSVVALEVLEACTGFAQWLDDREEPSGHALLARRHRLRTDLLRLGRFKEMMRAVIEANALRSPGCAEEDDPDPLGEFTAGLDRIVELPPPDSAQPELDYFRVLKRGEGAVFLTAPERRELGEVPLGPIGLPEGAEAKLREGDILHCEVEPEPGGWRLRALFGARPGSRT